jgi:AAA+ ATPase superfamily predicted ATPase
MVHFAKRLARPPVQEVTDSKDIEMLKQSKKNFFMYIGKSIGHTWVLDNFVIEIKVHFNFYKLLFIILIGSFL